MDTATAPTFADPYAFRPPTPAAAELALSKGMELRWMKLSEEERDLLIVGAAPSNLLRAGLADIEAERIAAAERILRRLQSRVSLYLRDRASEALGALYGQSRHLTDVATVFLVVKEMRQHVTNADGLAVMPWIKERGKRQQLRRADPWIPWEWSWPLTTRLMADWIFRRIVTAYAFPQESPVSEEESTVEEMIDTAYNPWLEALEDEERQAETEHLEREEHDALPTFPEAIKQAVRDYALAPEQQDKTDSQIHRELRARGFTRFASRDSIRRIRAEAQAEQSS